MKTLTRLRRSLILVPLVLCCFLSWYSAKAQEQPIPTAIVNARTVAIVTHVTSGGRTPAASDLRAEGQLKDEACLLLRESKYLAYEADPRRADLVLLLLGGKWKERTGGVIGMVFPGGLATHLDPPLWVAQSARGKLGTHADEIISALDRLVAQSRLQRAPYRNDLASLDQQDPGAFAAESSPPHPKSDFPAALITSKTSVALDYFDEYPFGYARNSKKPDKGSLAYALKARGPYEMVDDPRQADLILVIYKDFRMDWSARKERDISRAREALIILDARGPADWEITPLWMEQVGESDRFAAGLYIKTDLVGLLRKDIERRK